METKGNYLIFDTDDEFADFCVAPYAVIVDDGDIAHVECGYSDMYKQCLEEGKTIVIKEKNSKVCRRNCVCKRVPVMHNGQPLRGRTTLAQLRVDNVKAYDFIAFRLKKILS